jgi:hypothetical protein
LICIGKAVAFGLVLPGIVNAVKKELGQ